MFHSEKILVFDSGLGGLSVYDELLRQRPRADFLYVADDAAFPYGPWDGDALVAHLMTLIGGLIEAHDPAAVVVACNTASTLVLPHLRQRWPQIPFVGTVPAIKPAAAASRSRLIAVIATPGTVARDYTRTLIQDFAGDCRVVLVGSRHLAAYVEAEMRGTPIGDDLIAAEIFPCFVADAGRVTDVVVLACTHYPLLLPRLTRLAPWPVTWIDPAPAIARQAFRLLPAPGETGAGPHRGRFLFTSGLVPEGALFDALDGRGLLPTKHFPFDFAAATG